MVEYLESKLNQLTSEITTLEAELDTAVTNYVIALDNLGNYLRYELNDPSATLITNVVTEAAKEHHEYNPITRFVRSWLDPEVINWYLDSWININSIEQDLIKEVRKRLNKLLSYTNDRLLDVDKDYYTFNYFNYELRTRDKFDPLHKFWDEAIATSDSLVAVQSNLKELRCRSTALTREIHLASLSKDATFQLTSECTL